MAGQLASHDKCDLLMVDPASSREDLESKRRVVRACLYCRFRKIRCSGHDEGCTNCVRRHLECCYLPVTPEENALAKSKKQACKKTKGVGNRKRETRPPTSVPPLYNTTSSGADVKSPVSQPAPAAQPLLAGSSVPGHFERVGAPGQPSPLEYPTADPLPTLLPFTYPAFVISPPNVAAASPVYESHEGYFSDPGTFGGTSPESSAAYSPDDPLSLSGGRISADLFGAAVPAVWGSMCDARTLSLAYPAQPAARPRYLPQDPFPYLYDYPLSIVYDAVPSR